MNDNVATSADMIGITCAIIGAYVTRNSVSASELPVLIAATHAALTNLSAPAVPAQVEKLIPPVPIRKTVTPDYIISLEDGRQYKALKRRLTSRGMTPTEYRQKWGLPHDYPMTSPKYAAQRSAFAKSLGLGQIRREQEAGTKAAEPARRGRSKKVEAVAVE